MIRLRSQKLLSGVSALAMLAAFGAVDPVLAGALDVSGPGVFPAINNPSPTVDTDIAVDLGAVVQADGLGNAITNAGTLTSAADGISVDASVILGNILNSGRIDATGAFDGIDIRNGSVVDGGITNSNFLRGNESGIEINDSVMTGGITNSGAASQIIGVTAAGILITTNASVLSDITNQGTISGGTNGIELNASNLIGNITNSGASSRIVGATDGIYITGDSVMVGNITNAGTIAGGTNGIEVDDANVDFIGNITNSAGGTITGGTLDAIVLSVFSTFTGTISNSGLITAATSNTAIGIGTGAFTGNITNTTTGVISATGANGWAINLYPASTVTGNIINSGQILANGATGIGINLQGALTGTIQNTSTGTISANGAGGHAIEIDDATSVLTGGITNAGRILADGATGTAILINNGAVTGGITNSGTISGNGANGNAIVISGGTFAGGIANTGTIQANGDTAIQIALTTFGGNITNTGGLITSTADDAIEITAAVTNFNGSIVNSATGTITAAFEGIDWTGATFTGEIVNDGVIIAQSTGILLSGTTFTGSVTNNGQLTASGGNIALSVETGVAFSGSILNTGTIEGDTIGINIAGDVAGDVNNNGGTITGDLDGNASGDGIDVSGTVGGTIINSGLIDPVIGIDVSGVVTGGIDNAGGTITATSIGIRVTGSVGSITNSGAIAGENTGINVAGAASATNITQTAGSILGGEGGEGALGVAIDSTNAFAEVLTFNGGTLEGDVNTDATDDFIMGPSGTFGYLRGTAGLLDQFDMTGSGVATIGAADRTTNGVGATINAATMTFGGEGIVHLDNDSQINLTGAYTQTDGLLEFHVSVTPSLGVATVTAADYAQIVAGGAINQGGNIGVYIDPVTFSDPTSVVTGPLVYDDVLDGASRAGAFLNAATITSSSVFFTGAVTFDDADDVDITLTRLAFSDVIITDTFNQASVGGTLEDIYLGGEYGQQFTDLFAYLFDASTSIAEAQAAYDEISGSEHAQIHQAAFRSSGVFNENVRMRMDDMVASELGMTADLGGRQYAQAAISASDAMGGAGGSHGLTRGPSGVSIWARGFGQTANVDGDPEARGYDQDTTGATGGIDFAPSNNATVGVAGHWSNDDVDFDTLGDSAELSSWGVGGYGSYGFGRFYVDALVDYASHDIDTIRTISFTDPPITDAPFTALASYNATTWSIDGEVGMVWRLGRVNVSPSAGLVYTNLSVDGFTETGDADEFALIVNGADEDSLASTLALRASGQWMMGRTPIVPDIRVGWRHEFESDPMTFSAIFNTDNSTVFPIISSDTQEDSAVVRAGFTAGVSRNFEVFVNVNGQYNSDASATNASGGVRVTW